MWILESAGDFLGGKRLWLKPGKKYLFGRVKKDGVRFAIEHKTVSRRHLVIEVGDVPDGEVAQLHARTPVTIIDQNSKSGTTVNGHLLKRGDSDLPSRPLDRADNSVRPGSSEELIIRWQPCVITFNLQKKELRAGLLKQKQDRLRPYGIKAVAEFAADHTTHLVVGKRNTPKGLQALIAGRHLVAESFIDAIEYAATPSNIDGTDEDASPLELDFDRHWPPASDHLPPPGREPTSRPVEAYQPGPDRTHIFDRYTVVFGDRNQFDNLLPVVTAGHGKALHFNIDQGRTTVDELAAFVQKASQPRPDGGRVLLVRWESKASDQDWTSRLIDRVALRMGQRPVEQAEFLDAILANDASVLKQPIEHQDSHLASTAEAPPASTRPNDQSNGVAHVESSQAREQAPSPPSRKNRFGLPPPPKKDLVDDDFNPDDIAEYESEEEAEEIKAEEIKAEQANERKRQRTPSPVPSANSFEDQMDDLLPAATAMKRREHELEAEARQKGLPPPAPAPTVVDKPKAKRRRLEDREINIQEVIRSAREREREDEERRKARLQNLPPIDGTAKGPANLVVIETVDMPIRSHRSTAGSVNPEDDPRWDARWNGRKNFKRFRPQAAAAAAATTSHHGTSRASRVFVPLVEVRRRADDRSWGREQSGQQQNHHSDDDDDDVVIAPPPTQTQSRSKRRATSPPAKGPGRAKRQQTLPVTVTVSDSDGKGHGDGDDDDDMKFQFRRARRGAQRKT